MKEERLTVNISHGMDKITCIELNQSDLLTLAHMVKDYVTMSEGSNSNRIAKQINDILKRTE